MISKSNIFAKRTKIYFGIIANKDMKQTTKSTRKGINKKINWSNVRFFSVIFGLLFCCYSLLLRNNQVFFFRNQLWAQRFFVDIYDHDDFVNNIEHRYSYTKLLFSFKPLKTTYWFTPEEIEKYRLNLVDEALEKEKKLR